MGRLAANHSEPIFNTLEAPSVHTREKDGLDADELCGKRSDFDLQRVPIKVLSGGRRRRIFSLTLGVMDRAWILRELLGGRDALILSHGWAFIGLNDD